MDYAEREALTNEQSKLLSRMTGADGPALLGADLQAAIQRNLAITGELNPTEAAPEKTRQDVVGELGTKRAELLAEADKLEAQGKFIDADNFRDSADLMASSMMATSAAEAHEIARTESMQKTLSGFEQQAQADRERAGKTVDEKMTDLREQHVANGYRGRNTYIRTDELTDHFGATFDRTATLQRQILFDKEMIEIRNERPMR